MTRSARDRFLSAAIVLALTAVLLVLAHLQYRWSGQVSEAARLRMQSTLQTSLLGFRQDLYRELSGVCLAFQPNLNEGESGRYAQHYTQWAGMAVHPELVANVYVWKRAGTKRTRLERLDRETGEFRPTSWPPSLENLRDGLSLFPGARTIVVQRRPGSKPGPEMRTFRADAGPCIVAQNMAAMLRPVFEPTPSLARGTVQVGRAADWIVIELNGNVLRNEVFSEFARRYFGGIDGYRVAIVGGGERETIYSSDGTASKPITTPDGSIALFGPPRGETGTAPNILLSPMPPPEEVVRSLPGLVRVQSMGIPSEANDWTVIVQRRRGSLEAAAIAIRRRSLLISFGVLLVLAAAMALEVITSHRARRLARLQMDFVAAVSHELRTPLTVISTASENLADGVVRRPEQVREYGSTINNHAGQLIEMVEHVLAATRRNRRLHRRQLLDVGQSVDSALDCTSGLIKATGTVVEKEIQPDLPLIEADPAALSHCLRNLITNAVKYGGQARWLGVRALLCSADGTAEIQVQIQDKGIGIPSNELQQIFEPFYRTASATTAQIHGTGLGLPLAKSIAEAMGGKITVSSEPGYGSTFVLHIPPVSVSNTWNAAGPDRFSKKQREALTYVRENSGRRR